ncbi:MULTISPECIES: hypothetical protein [Emticicia]|uniref:hypothetical protein n=1 Tax=Emticicia TaxID=312278 RepID=UPI000C75EBCB|nr:MULTISPECIES: hypothetical protein [Emticicia]PLK46474.1 hypothetical protein C0V77_03795 [Emticicia sp. TH156]UTA68268.1 hypothetical protein MB380_00305 [Emticicia sp. 21SJ11W-3]
MAQVKQEIVDALRRTAGKLQAGTQYMWGHMGSCNCGNLAQEVTRKTKAEIHAYAMQGRGDWNEQLNDYCGVSAMPIDLLIFEMLTAGFTLEDLKNLEKLSDKDVLSRLPVEKRYLRHNVREDVIVYLLEWANMLEEQLLETIELPDFLQETALTHA